MKKVMTILAFGLLGWLALQALEGPVDYETNWPQWRGYMGSGVSPNGDPPLEWSETKNIKWKIRIPGRGHATPIIWGDMIIVSTAVDTGQPAGAPEPEADPEGEGQPQRRGMAGQKTSNNHKFVVLAIDRRNGDALWERTVTEEKPEEPTHEFGSWASNSAVTDGERIFAYFGSRGLFCLDMDGNIQWKRDFGQLAKHMNFGEGSSPTIYGDKVFVQWDHNGDSFLYALDKTTGKDAWVTPRDEQTSWATPLVVEVDGRPQVVTAATGKVRGYDAATGDLIWEGPGLTMNAIPHPVYADGLLYLMSGFRGNILLAVRIAEAKGNIEGTQAIVWSHDKDTPYTPSPVLVNGRLYFLTSNNGILNCFDAKTGREIYSGQRLEGSGNVFASPTATKDRIYIVGQSGTAYVVKEGPEFEILAKNELEDSFHASPVIIGKTLFLRGFDNLYCIEE